ncbi:hypothetical protein GOV07_02590 [Candidatus Woesearchaeota archaeon]|nr:hypothetical protein [Candidatus Woesearchaeota archaeon]
MGISVEFNPDLALRDISHYKQGKRAEDECIPKSLETGKTYSFLKKGQRNYWLDGELPLLETKGNQELSRPIASIMILEATHLKIDGEIWTKGKYRIEKVFNPHDEKVHFESYARKK